MKKLSPIARMSFSLALLTLSILLTGDLLFGVKSNPQQAALDSRQTIIESLAVQFSSLIGVDDMQTIRITLSNLGPTRFQPATWPGCCASAPWSPA